MKRDVKSSLTIMFSTAIIVYTGVLVAYAMIVGDTADIQSLLDRFSTAVIGGMSLSLGYFFGRHKVLEPSDKDRE
jgi:uncharacterized membrane protein